MVLVPRANKLPLALQIVAIAPPPPLLLMLLLLLMMMMAAADAQPGVAPVLRMQQALRWLEGGALEAGPQQPQQAQEEPQRRLQQQHGRWRRAGATPLPRAALVALTVLVSGPGCGAVVRAAGGSRRGRWQELTSRSAADLDAGRGRVQRAARRAGARRARL
jgi:hypothetical protein